MKIKLKKEKEVVVLKLTVEEARQLSLDMMMVSTRTTIATRRARTKAWAVTIRKALAGVMEQ